MSKVTQSAEKVTESSKNSSADNDLSTEVDSFTGFVSSKGFAGDPPPSVQQGVNKLQRMADGKQRQKAFQNIASRSSNSQAATLARSYVASRQNSQPSRSTSAAGTLQRTAAPAANTPENEDQPENSTQPVAPVSSTPPTSPAPIPPAPAATTNPTQPTNTPNPTPATTGPIQYATPRSPDPVPAPAEENSGSLIIPNSGRAIILSGHPDPQANPIQPATAPTSVPSQSRSVQPLIVTPGQVAQVQQAASSTNQPVPPGFQQSSSGLYLPSNGNQVINTPTNTNQGQFTNSAGNNGSPILVPNSANPQFTNSAGNNGSPILVPNSAAQGNSVISTPNQNPAATSPLILPNTAASSSQPLSISATSASNQTQPATPGRSTPIQLSMPTRTVPEAAPVGDLQERLTPQNVDPTNLDPRLAAIRQSNPHLQLSEKLFVNRPTPGNPNAENTSFPIPGRTSQATRDGQVVYEQEKLKSKVTVTGVNESHGAELTDGNGEVVAETTNSYLEGEKTTRGGTNKQTPMYSTQSRTVKVSNGTSTLNDFTTYSRDANGRRVANQDAQTTFDGTERTTTDSRKTGTTNGTQERSVKVKTFNGSSEGFERGDFLNAETESGSQVNARSITERTRKVAVTPNSRDLSLSVKTQQGDIQTDETLSGAASTSRTTITNGSVRQDTSSRRAENLRGTPSTTRLGWRNDPTRNPLANLGDNVRRNLSDNSFRTRTDTTKYTGVNSPNSRFVEETKTNEDAASPVPFSRDRGQSTETIREITNGTDATFTRTSTVAPGGVYNSSARVQGNIGNSRSRDVSFGTMGLDEAHAKMTKITERGQAVLYTNKLQQDDTATNALEEGDRNTKNGTYSRQMTNGTAVNSQANITITDRNLKYDGSYNRVDGFLDEYGNNYKDDRFSRETNSQVMLGARTENSGSVQVGRDGVLLTGSSNNTLGIAGRLTNKAKWNNGNATFGNDTTLDALIGGKAAGNATFGITPDGAIASADGKLFFGLETTATNKSYLEYSKHRFLTVSVDGSASVGAGVSGRASAVAYKDEYSVGLGFSGTLGLGFGLGADVKLNTKELGLAALQFGYDNVCAQKAAAQAQAITQPVGSAAQRINQAHATSGMAVQHIQNQATQQPAPVAQARPSAEAVLSQLSTGLRQSGDASQRQAHLTEERVMAEVNQANTYEQVAIQANQQVHMQAQDAIEQAQHQYDEAQQVAQMAETHAAQTRDQTIQQSQQAFHQLQEQSLQKVEQAQQQAQQQTQQAEQAFHQLQEQSLQKVEQAQQRMQQQIQQSQQRFQQLQEKSLQMVEKAQQGVQQAQQQAEQQNQQAQQAFQQLQEQALQMVEQAQQALQQTQSQAQSADAAAASLVSMAQGLVSGAQSALGAAQSALASAQAMASKGGVEGMIGGGAVAAAQAAVSIAQSALSAAQGQLQNAIAHQQSTHAAGQTAIQAASSRLHQAQQQGRQMLQQGRQRMEQTKKQGQEHVKQAQQQLHQTQQQARQALQQGRQQMEQTKKQASEAFRQAQQQAKQALQQGRQHMEQTKKQAQEHVKQAQQQARQALQQGRQHMEQTKQKADAQFKQVQARAKQHIQVAQTNMVHVQQQARTRLQQATANLNQVRQKVSQIRNTSMARRARAHAMYAEIMREQARQQIEATSLHSRLTRYIPEPLAMPIELANNIRHSAIDTSEKVSHYVSTHRNQLATWAANIPAHPVESFNQAVSSACRHANKALAAPDSHVTRTALKRTAAKPEGCQCEGECKCGGGHNEIKRSFLDTGMQALGTVLPLVQSVTKSRGPVAEAATTPAETVKPASQVEPAQPAPATAEPATTNRPAAQTEPVAAPGPQSTTPVAQAQPVEPAQPSPQAVDKTSQPGVPVRIAPQQEEAEVMEGLSRQFSQNAPDEMLGAKPPAHWQQALATPLSPEEARANLLAAVELMQSKATEIPAGIQAIIGPAQAKVEGQLENYTQEVLGHATAIEQSARRAAGILQGKVSSFIKGLAEPSELAGASHELTFQAGQDVHQLGAQLQANQQTAQASQQGLSGEVEQIGQTAQAEVGGLFNLGQQLIGGLPVLNGLAQPIQQVEQQLVAVGNNLHNQAQNAVNHVDQVSTAQEGVLAQIHHLVSGDILQRFTQGEQHIIGFLIPQTQLGLNTLHNTGHMVHEQAQPAIQDLSQRTEHANQETTHLHTEHSKVK